jgi:hypothetical protein
LDELLEVVLKLLVEGLHRDAVAARRHTSRVLLDRIMREAQPIRVAQQGIQAIERSFFVLGGP